VNADDLQPFVCVLVVPGVEVGLDVLAVVASVGPELEQDNLLLGGVLYGEVARADERARSY
jgi:hypothetical protein